MHSSLVRRGVARANLASRGQSAFLRGEATATGRARESPFQTSWSVLGIFGVAQICMAFLSCFIMSRTQSDRHGLVASP